MDKIKIGSIVGFFHNGNDVIAANNSATYCPAIVTNVFPQNEGKPPLLNLCIFPDAFAAGYLEVRTSVPHREMIAEGDQLSYWDEI